MWSTVDFVEYLGILSYCNSHPFHLQLFSRQCDVCFQSLLPSNWIHSSPYQLFVPCTTCCNTSQFTSVPLPHSRLVVMFFWWNFATFFPPNVPLLITTKKDYRIIPLDWLWKRHQASFKAHVLTSETKFCSKDAGHPTIIIHPQHYSTWILLPLVAWLSNCSVR